MDKINEELEELQAIADRCETEEDVFREVSRLSPEQKMRMVYGTAMAQFVEDVQETSIQTLDFCIDNGLLNDHESKTFRRDQCLGILSCIAKTYLLSTEQATRQELQCMSEYTEFASRIAGATNTAANSMIALLEKLIQLDSAYTAILTGRKMNVHFINDDGDHEPFSDQELEAKAQQAEYQQAEREKYYDSIRAAVEEVYWGLPPRALDEEENARQLAIPLWVGS